jgi:hypothetical protein
MYWKYSKNILGKNSEIWLLLKWLDPTVKFSWASNSNQKKHLSDLHLLHLAINPSSSSHYHITSNLSSSSYCAHGSELEFKFTPMMKEIKKGLMIQCITSKVQFSYFCSKCICICLRIRNLNIIDQLCIFHKLESIHVTITNNQI